MVAGLVVYVYPTYGVSLVSPSLFLYVAVPVCNTFPVVRSEERRVGKECRL